MHSFLWRGGGYHCLAPYTYNIDHLSLVLACNSLYLVIKIQGEPPPVAKSPGPPSVPAPPTPTQNAVVPGVWTITPADRTRYDQIFNSLGPEANKIHGAKVSNLVPTT